MSRIETWFDQDLMCPVKVNRVTQIFSEDSLGNLIGVRVTKDGEIYNLSGSVTGYCILADGTTVPVIGTINENRAYIILTASVYSVPGPISIVLKNTDGSAVTTLCACAGFVALSRTSSQIDPGQTVTDWTNQITAQLQAVQDAADNVGAIVAAPFSENTAYVAGNYVTNDGNLYRITANHAPGVTWANTSKVQCTAGAELVDLKSAINDFDNVVNAVSGVTHMLFEPGYYKTPEQGSAVTKGANANCVTSYFPVAEGDRITMNVGGGNGNYRAYVFIDSSGNALNRVATGLIGEHTVIVPTNAVAMAVNNWKPNMASGYYVYKNVSTAEKLSALSNDFVPIKESFLQTGELINIPFSVTDGYFVRYTDGTIGTSGTSSVTDYVNVYFFDQITYKRKTSTSVAAGSTAGIAFFDKDLNWVGGDPSLFEQQTLEYVWRTVDVPRNAVYVRCSTFTDTETYGEFEIKGHSYISQTLNDFHNSVYYPVSATRGISYGGIQPNGASSGSSKWIRYLFDGLGAVNVKAGSIVVPNSGYKVTLALYSSYNSNSDFVLSDYVDSRETEYIVPYDCFLRIAIATTDNLTLFTIDEEKQISLTQAGEIAAESGVVLNLIGGTVKEEVEKISTRTTTNIWDETIRLESEIPLNALDFHALFDGLVTTGKLQRTLVGKQDNDDNYPIYLYTLRNDMNHLNSSYKIIQWNGSNELYTRPKIWLDSGIHGNERTTPYALFDFINKLCTKIEYQDMRNAFDWYFVPLVNPWGFSNSAIKTSTGILDNGSNYTSSNKDQYTIVANTSTVHQGIRRNKDGIDINRDFGSFVTAEAQMIHELLDELTADNRNFIFAMDSHQSSQGDDVNVIGAFMSMNYSADAAAKAFMWGKWMQAGAKTEMLIANDTDRDVIQSIYSWDGTNSATARNYLANYADYSMCFEGGQTCVYYSQSKEWSNPVARNLSNTQYQLFLHILTQYWMIGS